MSESHPGIVEELLAEWEDYVAENGVLVNPERNSGLHGYRFHIDITGDLLSPIPDAIQEPQETLVRRSRTMVFGQEPHRRQLEG